MRVVWPQNMSSPADKQDGGEKACENREPEQIHSFSFFFRHEQKLRMVVLVYKLNLFFFSSEKDTIIV